MLFRHFPARVTAALNIVLVALFLSAASAALPAHGHHGSVDDDHPCVFCHLIGAPVELSSSSGEAVSGALEVSIAAVPARVDFIRPAQETARSSHPLRGPPSL